MKTFTVLAFLACNLFGCTQKHTKQEQIQPNQKAEKMDRFEFSFESAHPNAKALMKDDFYWDSIEETAPFGSDDGSDAAYGFVDWRSTHKNNSPVLYLKELISEWDYPFFDYNEMDTTKILEYINHKQELSESEIQQKVNALKDISAKAADSSTKRLNDDQLRQIVVSSSNSMNSTFLLGQDNAIIGIGFAQFVLEGTIDNDIKKATITAIKRQLLPILINSYDEKYIEIRKKQLTKMLEVIQNI